MQFSVFIDLHGKDNSGWGCVCLRVTSPSGLASIPVSSLTSRDAAIPKFSPFST